MYLCTLCASMHGPGPCRGRVRPTREAKLSRAVREVRDLIRPWGDGDNARLIRAVLDRNDV
jgi:hypothetical protein